MVSREKYIEFITREESSENFEDKPDSYRGS